MGLLQALLMFETFKVRLILSTVLSTGEETYIEGFSNAEV